MAYSIQTAVSDGTLDTLDLSIDYMDKSHIKVTIDDVPVDGTHGHSYSWLTDTRISITPAVPNGKTLKLVRQTVTAAMWHEFTQGARFSTTSMDENFRQLLFVAQEYSEGVYVADFYTDLDMHLHQIKNLADATQDNDAVNLAQLKAYAYDAGLVAIDGTLTVPSPAYSAIAKASGTSTLATAINTSNTQLYAGILRNKQRLDRSNERSIYEFANPALDGVTDDSAQLQLALDTAPVGTTLTWRGALRIANPVVCTRRVGIVLDSPLDCIIVDVGLGNIGFTYEGPAAGINEIQLHINVYGPANCADSAVRIARVDRSEHLYINVYAGTAQHAVILAGCLINKDMGINSSANFLPPYAGMEFQAKHIHIVKSLGVAFNDNLVWVNLEGGGEGILGDNMTSEGNNTFYGCIEGLTSGRPMDITGWMLPVVRDLHFEANAMAPIFRNCTLPTIGPNVLHAMEGKPIEFENCRQPYIDGYYGEYKFDDLCVSPHVGRVLAMSSLSQQGEGYYMSAEASAAAVWTGNTDASYGGAGSFQLENIFHNPFMDVWDGLQLVGATAVGSTGIAKTTYPLPVYTDNEGLGKSAFVNVTSTGAFDGIRLQCKPPYNKGRHGGHYVSVTVALLVAGGNPDVIVFVYANGSLYDIGVVTAKNKWVLVRGSVRVPEGSEFFVSIRPYTAGVGYVAGEFYVGGCTIVKGNRPAKFIGDSIKRRENIASDVSWPPSFAGQDAYDAGTGKWYKAKDNTAATDWVLLN